MMGRRVVCVASSVVALAIASSARAQPSASDANREAERHFRLAIALVEKKAWDSALAELDESRRLAATPNAIKNAAVCLRELGRYDEALDMYDELKERFGARLSDTERREIAADVERLSRWVGELVIDTDPGATVTVDGRRLSETTPLKRPIRLKVGTRAVTIAKAGYANLEEKVRITSREKRALKASLVAVSRLGELSVSAPDGFEVVVDGTVVGRTPWRGTIIAGTHTLALRNERDEGTPAAPVEVRMGETTELALSPTTLPGRLRIEPTPADARVAVDGGEVSRGSYSGIVASASHDVAVVAPWYRPYRERVVVTSRDAQAVRPVLEPVHRAYLEIRAGAVPVYDTGARLGLGDCTEPCVGGFIGIRGGYQVLPRLSIELFIDGAFLPRQATTDFQGIAFDGSPASASYTENANNVLYFSGAALRYQFFERTPLTLRLSGGLVRGFESLSGEGSFTFGQGVGFFGYSAPSSIAYWAAGAMPEVRFGYRFGFGLAMDLGVGILLTHTPEVAPLTELGQAEDFLRRTDGGAPTPPSPSFAGGFSYALPVTAAFQLEL